MNASPTPKTPKTAKATSKPPKAKAPTVKAPKATADPENQGQPTANPLAGVTIRAEVMTYKPDLHRPRLHITTPTGAYYKLVPGVRTTTKAEALTAAQTYRAQILASGQLPPKGERQAKAKPPATPATPTRVIPGVTRVEVD